MAKYSWYWSEKSHDAWADARKKGKWHFVFFKGVLGWGVPMFLVMACGPVFLGFPYWADPTRFYWVWEPLLWVSAGLFYGMATWHTSEKFFLRYERQSP